MLKIKFKANTYDDSEVENGYIYGLIFSFYGSERKI